MEIAETFGLEFEFSNSNREILSSKIPYGWKTTHDASSETGIFYLPSNKGTLYIQSDTFTDFILPLVKLGLFGGEVVSPKLNNSIESYDEIKSVLFQLRLENPSVDNRCSTHVHINVTKEYPLYALRNFIYLIRSMEKFLYTVSGFTHINRGITNNFLFQRPIDHPHYIPTKAGSLFYVPAYDSEVLLTVDSIGEFWYMLCDSSREMKYNPARYCGVSLPSIPLRGSVEFRYGNVVHDFTMLKAYINLCRNITKASFNISLPDILKEKRSIVTNDNENYVSEYREILENHLILNDEDADILMNMYLNLPTPYLNPKPITTHIPDFYANSVWESSEINKMDIVNVDDCVIGESIRGDNIVLEMRKMIGDGATEIPKDVLNLKVLSNFNDDSVSTVRTKSNYLVIGKILPRNIFSFMVVSPNGTVVSIKQKQIWLETIRLGELI